MIVLIAIYDGLIFHSRWASDQAFKNRVNAAQDELNRRGAALYGPDTLRILTYYASPAAVRRGQEVIVCYGVRGAKSVTLDPPVEEVWPALAHCVRDTPQRDTDYKLSAVDGKGNSVSRTLTVQVIR